MTRDDPSEHTEPTYSPEEYKQQAAGVSSFGLVWLLLTIGGFAWLINAISK